MKIKIPMIVILTVFLLIMLPSIQAFEYHTIHKEQEKYYPEAIQGLNSHEFRNKILQSLANIREIQKAFNDKDITTKCLLLPLKWASRILLKILLLPIKLAIKIIVKILVLPIKLMLLPLKILLFPITLLLLPLKLFIIKPITFLLRLLMLPAKLIHLILSIINPLKKPLPT